MSIKLATCFLLLSVTTSARSADAAGELYEGTIRLDDQVMRFELETADGWWAVFYGHEQGPLYGTAGEAVLNAEGLHHVDSRERIPQTWEDPEQAEPWLKMLFLPFSEGYFDDYLGDEFDYRIPHGELFGPQRLIDGYPIRHHWIKRPGLECHWYLHAGTGSVYGAAGRFDAMDFTILVEHYERDGSIDPAAFLAPRWRSLSRRSEEFLRELCVENTLYLQDALEAFQVIMTVQDEPEAREHLQSLGYSLFPSPYPGVLDELSRVLPGFEMPLNPYTGQPARNTFGWKPEELSRGNFYYEPVSYIVNYTKGIEHFKRYTLLGFDDNGICKALTEHHGELEPVEIEEMFAARDAVIEENQQKILESAETTRRRAKRLEQIRRKRAEALKKERDEKGEEEEESTD